MNRQTIENVLMEIGMPVNLKGFTYITDAVMLLDTPEWKNPKWTAMYYKIAAMNGDTPTRVERAIRSAFTSTRHRVANYDMIEHYIGFANCENSNSITYLYKNIKMDYPETVQPSFDDLEITADTIKEIVRQTLKEMLKEIA